jgi:ATP-dependent DNA helicase RecG
VIQFWNPGDVFGNADHLLEPGEKEVRNPQIVAAFRRLGLCEQAGTGLRMVLNQWQALGHLEPEYDNDRSHKTFEIRLPLAKDQVTPQATGEVTSEVTGEVTGEVQKFLKILHTPMSRSEAQITLKLKGQANFRDRYLKPALDLELVEMTIPDKQRSSKQKYRLTDRGKEWVEQNQAEKQS